MTAERPMSAKALMQICEEKAEHIMEEFEFFTRGPRMLMLLQREKDGGSHHEEKRNLCSRFSFTPEQYKRSLEELLWLKQMYPTSRIYASLNERSIPKVIRVVEQELLDSHYTPDEELRENVYKKLIRAPRHFFMQPRCAKESLFLIDVDNEEGKDVMGEALSLAATIPGLGIIKQYRTKNGWHIITTPFNPALWTHKSELKKDPLILLDY